MLKSDNWNMGPAGQKKKYKVWVCRECSAKREFDSTFRMAAQALFHEERAGDKSFIRNKDRGTREGVLFSVIEK